MKLQQLVEEYEQLRDATGEKFLRRQMVLPVRPKTDCPETNAPHIWDTVETLHIAEDETIYVDICHNCKVLREDIVEEDKYIPQWDTYSETNEAML